MSALHLISISEEKQVDETVNPAVDTNDDAAEAGAGGIIVANPPESKTTQTPPPPATTTTTTITKAGEDDKILRQDKWAMFLIDFVTLSNFLALVSLSMILYCALRLPHNRFSEVSLERAFFGIATVQLMLKLCNFLSMMLLRGWCPQTLLDASLFYKVRNAFQPCANCTQSLKKLLNKLNRNLKFCCKQLRGQDRILFSLMSSFWTYSSLICFCFFLLSSILYRDYILNNKDSSFEQTAVQFYFVASVLDYFFSFVLVSCLEFVEFYDRRFKRTMIYELRRPFRVILDNPNDDQKECLAKNPFTVTPAHITIKVVGANFKQESIGMGRSGGKYDFQCLIRVGKRQHELTVSATVDANDHLIQLTTTHLEQVSKKLEELLWNNHSPDESSFNDKVKAALKDIKETSVVFKFDKKNLANPNINLTEMEHAFDIKEVSDSNKLLDVFLKNAHNMFQVVITAMTTKNKDAGTNLKVKFENLLDELHRLESMISYQPTN